MTSRPVIKDGVVINVVEIDEAGGNWAPPDGCVLGAEGGAIGDVWNGVIYITQQTALDENVSILTVELGPTIEERVADLEKRLAALEARK